MRKSIAFIVCLCAFFNVGYSQTLYNYYPYQTTLTAVHNSVMFFDCSNSGSDFSYLIELENCNYYSGNSIVGGSSFEINQNQAQFNVKFTSPDVVAKVRVKWIKYYAHSPFTPVVQNTQEWTITVGAYTPPHDPVFAMVVPSNFYQYKTFNVSFTMDGNPLPAGYRVENWSNDFVVTSGNNTQSLQGCFNTNGSKNLSFRIHSPTGVSGGYKVIYQTVTVVPNPRPLNKIGGNQNPGVGTNIVYFTEPFYHTAQVDYIWSVTPTTGVTVLYGEYNGANFILNFSQQGNYTIRGQITDKDNGLVSVKYLDVVVDSNGPITRSTGNNDFIVEATNDYFTISSGVTTKSNIYVELRSISDGKLVYKDILSKNGGSVDLSSIGKGIYLLILKNGENTPEVHKIAIE